jgi:hypothetical protein
MGSDWSMVYNTANPAVDSAGILPRITIDEFSPMNNVCDGYSLSRAVRG